MNLSWIAKKNLLGTHIFQAVSPHKKRKNTTWGRRTPHRWLWGWAPYPLTNNFLASRVCLHKMEVFGWRELVGPVCWAVWVKRIGNTWGFLASHRNTNHVSVFVEMMVLGNELLIPKENQGSVVHIREPHVILWLEGIAQQMLSAGNTAQKPKRELLESMFSTILEGFSRYWQ